MVFSHPLPGMQKSAAFVIPCLFYKGRGYKLRRLKWEYVGASLPARRVGEKAAGDRVAT